MVPVTDSGDPCPDIWAPEIGAIVQTKAAAECMDPAGDLLTVDTTITDVGSSGCTTVYLRRGNLLLNPSFEGSLTSWTVAHVTLNSGFALPPGPKDGADYASVSIGGGGTGTASQAVTVTSSTDYLVSVWIANDSSPTAVDFKLNVDPDDGGLVTVDSLMGV